jgi:hypothetical protein
MDSRLAYVCQTVARLIEDEHFHPSRCWQEDSAFDRRLTAEVF